MTVTTLVDVEAVLGRAVTTDELGYVDRVLELIEADVLAQLPGYDLNPASVETVTIAGVYGNEVVLPKYPVSAVTSVSQYGATIAPSGWSWTARGTLKRLGYYESQVANATPSYGTWGGPAASLTVTYTHGQPAAGSPLVLLIAEAVAAHLASTGTNGLQSMSLGDYSETYAPRRGAGVVDRSRLARFRRATVGTVRLVGA